MHSRTSYYQNVRYFSEEQVQHHYPGDGSSDLLSSSELNYLRLFRRSDYLGVYVAILKKIPKNPGFDPLLIKLWRCSRASSVGGSTIQLDSVCDRSTSMWSSDDENLVENDIGTFSRINLILDGLAAFIFKNMAISLYLYILVLSVSVEWVVALESQPSSSSITSYNNKYHHTHTPNHCTNEN